MEQGNFEHAEQTLRQALTLAETHRDPSAALTMLELARTLLVQEKLSDAEKTLMRALNRLNQPDPAIQHAAAGALQALASLYWAAGRFREAETAARGALAIAGLHHPDSPVILGTLGLALKGQGKTTAAALHLEQALAILEPIRSPELPAVLYILGQVRFQQKNFDQAEQLYRRALVLEPADQHLLANLKSALGTTLMKRGLREEGFRLSEEAVALSLNVYAPGHRSAAAILHDHAQILHALGRKREAKTLETQAKEISERSSSLRTLPPRVDRRALYPSGSTRSPQ